MDPTRLETRKTLVAGELEIRRALPTIRRRMVGAWCFLDHFGPAPPPMTVGPHPHIGLQTLTWLISGNNRHRDSLGNIAAFGAQQAALMTSGRGLVHAEESPEGASDPLHGVQLWIALPDSNRHCDPAFDLHADLPQTTIDALSVTVFAGESFGLTSPARMYSQIVGAQLSTADSGRTTLPLRRGWEYIALTLRGRATIAGLDADLDHMIDLADGRDHVEIETHGAATILLLGGAPFPEPIFMWWNFVARSKAEVAAALADWQAGELGEVAGARGAALSAPPAP